MAFVSHQYKYVTRKTRAHPVEHSIFLLILDHKRLASWAAGTKCAQGATLAFKQKLQMKFLRDAPLSDFQENALGSR